MHCPAQELQPISITWPFAVWGLDMLRPFRKVLWGFMYLFVVGDKFTKWIEAKAFISVRSKEVVGFFCDIVYRFGVQNSVITKSGPQFIGKKFQHFCNDFNIELIGPPWLTHRQMTKSRAPTT
jgi:hypothetical protein